MKSLCSGIIFVSALYIGTASIYGQTPSEKFWDSNHLVPVPLGKQDIKPGELIILQGSTPLYYEPQEPLTAYPMRMDVPYIQSDKDLEVGVFAKIFGFSPSLKFKSISSITVEPAKLTGMQFHDDDVDQKLLPTTGETATKSFLKNKTYATVYIVTAVLNTAHMKITENQGRSIAFTSGPDVSGCTLPQPEAATPKVQPSSSSDTTAQDGTASNTATPKKATTDGEAATKKSADEATAAAKAKTDAAASKGTVSSATPAVDTPGGGGSICQSKKGVVEVNTPEGVAVAMRVYRLWWSNTDNSWNLAMDKYKDLPKF